MNLELQSDETKWRDDASRGDSVALGHIYDAYAERIYYYLCRRVGDSSLAQDLTADVFLRMVEAVGTRQFCQGPLAPWLYRLAHNRMIDHFRRNKEVPMPEDLPDPADGSPSLSVELGVEPGVLRSALRLLTPDQQQVIALKFLEDWSNAQVAVALGKSEGAVESLQFRALSSLRRILEER